MGLFDVGDLLTVLQVFPFYNSYYRCNKSCTLLRGGCIYNNITGTWCSGVYVCVEYTDSGFLPSS